MSNGGRSGLRLVGGGFVAGGNSGRRRVKDECEVRRAPHWLASSFLCGVSFSRNEPRRVGLRTEVCQDVGCADEWSMMPLYFILSADVCLAFISVFLCLKSVKLPLHV